MTKIRFNSIQADTVRFSSGLFTGINIQRNWSNQARKTEGFGAIEGNANSIVNNLTISRGIQKQGFQNEKKD